MKFRGSLFIIIICVTAILLMHFASVSARVEGKPINLERDDFAVYVLKTTGDLNLLWEEKKVKRRIIVHLGKFLHYVTPQESEGKIITKTMPIAREARSYSHRETENYMSFLWFSFHENVAREIYNVIPRTDFIKRFSLEDTANLREKIVEHDLGSPRVISYKIPSIREPVLLNIDASYFGSAEATVLLNTLLKSGLKPDIVTICMSEDNPDVTETERRQATAFIRHLPERVKIIHYPTSPKTAAIVK